MRNILMLFVLLFSVSCGPGNVWDEPYVPDNKTYFHPPTWIQGEWLNETNIYEGFKFTKDDFIVHYNSGSGVSYNERINYLGIEYLSSKEVITSGSYKITITHLTDNISVYDFIFVTANEVHCNYDATIYGERTTESYILKKI